MQTKLHIFKVVAQHLSFTKAAEQLHISQPAISKTIRNLEETYKTSFFTRKRNSINLTKEGKSFLIYVNKIIEIYNQMDEQFLYKNETFPETINLGVSTTLSNYVLPKTIAKFRNQFPNTIFNIISDNTIAIEDLILKETINFGITEGQSSNPKLHYSKFIKDEIVLVTNANNTSFSKGIITKDTLVNLPIAQRETGSGTKSIIDSTLKINNLKLNNVVVTFNSTQAIKNYLYHSEDYALLSINAVTEDLISNRLKVIDIKDFTINRWFYFVKRTGYISKQLENLERFIKNSHNF